MSKLMRLLIVLLLALFLSCYTEWYAARDRNGTIHVFTGRPARGDSTWAGNNPQIMPDYYHPMLAWEDEPRLVLSETK